MGDEKHVHQRKRTAVKNVPLKSVTSKGSESKKTKAKQDTVLSNVAWYISSAIGLCLMIILAFEYSKLCNDLHEAQMWFSNIKEVEREISFRTESGLYYSYYKQLVNAPTLGQGMHALMNDNLTEHTVRMNVLERMNIYQEVVLGILYRMLPFIKKHLEPVYFYIYSVYGLHGGLLCSVFLTSWVLSGTWVSGVLAAAFYVFNKDQTTRVSYIIPLRESFSLPFLWSQILCITILFRTKTSKLQERISTIGILLSTFWLSLFWQFNQFVLLLQAMALFGVQVLHIVPHRKVRNVYLCQLASLFGVFLLQFFNTMIVGGLAVSFIVSALVIMAIQGERPSSHGIVLRIFKVLIYIGLVFTLMMSFMKLIKLVIHVEADEHIYKFVLHKFGIAFSGDFDVQLYLCNGAFEFMTPDVIKALTKKLVFPFYAVCHVIGIISVIVGTFYRWRQESTYKKSEDPVDDAKPPIFCLTRPEVAYNLVQPVFFGAVAVSTVRMKYLWTPYMCILASFCISDYESYKWVFNKLQISSRIVLEIIRHGMLIAVLCALVSLCLPGIKEEVNDLREFYDPDTVQLMEWIKDKTPENASFSGSMQLLAGVKLCTRRPITNHPHYEDKQLRLRTRELYTMYSKTPAQQVHQTLKKYDTSYIILEDSICMAVRDSCGLPVQLDVDMGIMPDKPRMVKDTSNLVVSDVPRFCDEIRHMKAPYNKFFKSVFKNKTFRIYQVL